MIRHLERENNTYVGVCTRKNSLWKINFQNSLTVDEDIYHKEAKKSVYNELF